MRFFFFFFLFGCGCGDLKRRDFWDWLFGRGFDVEFRACFKKRGPWDPAGQVWAS